jgi:hypothetical protein
LGCKKSRLFCASSSNLETSLSELSVVRPFPFAVTLEDIKEKIGDSELTFHRPTLRFTRWFKALALVCVALTVFVGMAQAIHVHPDNTKLPSHECSLCSIAHTGFVAATTHSFVPELQVTAVAVAKQPIPRFSGYFSSYSIRPPPVV